MVDDFINGFRATQRFSGAVEAGELHGIRYLVFPGGRRLTRFTHEFFVREAEPEVAIAVAQNIDPRGNHFISVLSNLEAAKFAAYRAAGYVHWGNETLMVRDLTVDLPSLSDMDVREVTSLDEGKRVYEAQRDAGLDGHPVTTEHCAAQDLIQRWVCCQDQPAAFGRIVLLGDSVYLSDVVTLPRFRRRGLADALIRQLLNDARSAGATRCVLTSSEMATQLYAGLGFRAALPLIGFETP